jgi:hypothetical protein
MIRRYRHLTYVRRRVEELRLEVLNLALRFPYFKTAGKRLIQKAQLLHKYEEKLQCISLM